jgi:hypothetical protein
MPYNLLNNSLEKIISLCFKWQTIKKRLDRTQHGKAYKMQRVADMELWTRGWGCVFPRLLNFRLGQPAEQPGGTQQPTVV